MTGWGMYERVLLALTDWREARGESYDCRLAVACCVRNRVQNPKWWGNDYVSCLIKRWQFSSMSDPNDRQLTTWPAATDHIFEECLGIASAVIDNQLKHPMPGADSYYDVSIMPPKWATTDKKVGQIGRIIFYNIDGDTDD